MICISIAQELRLLALADMVNAARQCDLLELRLDKFAKTPNVGEFLAAKTKPIIVGCRRPQDGGNWQGSEEERLALLRQSIVARADYVEIELDVADQIRKFPPSQRVISYTNFRETPADMAAIYEQARSKNPDVIKLTTLARTPEEAWPLVQILARPPVPTVVVGLGKPGIMLTVLGRKMGAPWTYAALERGLEAYPGQPTIEDLETIYHYRDLARSTRLVGVTGMGEQEAAIVAALNAALAQQQLAARCLPLQVGDLRLFRKVIDAVKLTSVVVAEPHRSAILEIAGEQEPAVRQTGVADLIVHQPAGWHGYNVLCRAAATSLEAVLRGASQAAKPLVNRTVLVVGTNAIARSVAWGVTHRGGAVIVAGRDHDAAQQLAHTLSCRHIAYEALYTTMYDVLIVCSEEKETLPGHTRKTGLHPGVLKPHLTVMDLTRMPRPSVFLRDARSRGCTVVSPRQVLQEQLGLQLRLLTGKEPEQGVLRAVLDAHAGEDE